jgi:CRP-like cAMP-binding protein
VTETPAPQNQLITRLPAPDRQRLMAVCEPVQLLLSQVLCERGEPTRHVWLPTTAFITLLAQVDGHPSLEVGMVGREGLLGAHLALGVDTVPLRALVQGAGAAWSVPASAFQRELGRSQALRGLLDRYLFVRLAQMATAAACLRFHLIGPRLARWLLMSQDRAHADTFHVTHEFLSGMLGVRRVGVTTAAGELQRLGLIHYHRGELRVLDRCGLERAACTCYAADRAVEASAIT